MAQEQSKSAKRRYFDGAFLSRYFVGAGLDIGAGDDGLARYAGVFPRITSIREWDLPDGDAQLLPGIADASFDFIHASHCLEHMRDVMEALGHWIRVTRPGGHLIITVPEEDMYERGRWPSESNPDHKHTFTAYKPKSWSPVSLNVLDLAARVSAYAELERLNVIRDFYVENWDVDQTRGPVAECAIEFVLRRRRE